MTTKVTVNLPDELLNALADSAEKRGITKTEALRQALANDKFLRDTIESESQVLIKEKDGTLQRLIIP